MKKPSNNQSVTDLIGLGNHSTRKSYYPELVTKLDELEDEKNRYKWLFENALHGIFRAQWEGGIISANPALIQICGYPDNATFHENISSIGEQLFCYHADYHLFSQQLLEQGKVFGFETQFRRFDGECVHISMNALLKEEPGKRSTIEAFVQDITERKKAQDNLRRLNGELEQRVENRTRELVTVNDKLWQEISERELIQKELELAKEAAEEANNSKDKYLAAASHDLLQPMNAARLLISALRERELAEQDSHLVERVHLALENAEVLLTDLLDISKLDQDAVKPDFSDFRLHQFLSAMVKEFQAVAEDKNIELRFCPSSVIVHSDSRLLLRIIRNFISNAIRYTNKGTVLVGCRRHSDHVSIQVCDTGNGIPKEKLKEIFQEFKQLDCHKVGGRQGVGLGLAIVDRIARILDHKIEVQSVEGRGSVFTINVPVSEQKTVEQFTPSAQLVDAGQLQGLSVLVIDNEENILASMRALLEPWGCRLATATSEQQALQRCVQGDFIPDVILADYHLDNDYLGTDAILAIRQQLDDEIPAVMLTADRSDQCRNLFREMGLNVLNKPVKPGKLRALLTYLA